MTAVGAKTERTDGTRRCLATGSVRPREELVRFVAGPDGTVVPDLDARLPGRGLWVTAARPAIAEAARKNLFARAARRPLAAPDDLADRVEAALARRCVELIGLARRAGAAVAGFEKVRGRLRAGEARLLLAACDGADGGRGKVRMLAPELPLCAALTAAELGAAFGRETTVHAVVTDVALARRLAREGARLAGLRDEAPTRASGVRGVRDDVVSGKVDTA